MVGSEDRIMEQAVYLAHHYLPIRKTLGAYQLNQVTLGEGHKEAIAFLHQITCQLCLVLLQLLNFLLYRVPTDEANRNHLFVLPNAVAAVDGLVFDCRVPPWIDQEHIVGFGKIEAGATCFQADQKHPCMYVVLKLADHFLPVGRAAGKHGVANVLFGKFFLDQV